MVFLLIAAALFVAVVVWDKLVYPKYVKPELSVILADLESTATKLATFADNKLVEVADHLEEIALHQTHVDLKKADAARAGRIRDKLNELLQ